MTDIHMVAMSEYLKLDIYAFLSNLKIDYKDGLFGTNTDNAFLLKKYGSFLLHLRYTYVQWKLGGDSKILLFVLFWDTSRLISF